MLSLLTAALLLAQTPKLDVLVVSGGHSYDTIPFNNMWKSFPRMNVTFQVLPVGNEIFEDVSAWKHDVLVFYNEQDPAAKFTDNQKANFLSLLDKGIGIVVMHHAAASYPRWPEFEKIAGIKYISRNFFPVGDSTSVATSTTTHNILVLDTAHPIVKGMPASFQLVEEGYKNMRFGTGNHLLWRTHSPVADTPAAWTRHYLNSRIFVTVLGHGPLYTAPLFRTLMNNGTLWTAPCESPVPSAACPTAIAPASARAAPATPDPRRLGEWLWPGRDSWWDASGRAVGDQATRALGDQAAPHR